MSKKMWLYVLAGYLIGSYFGLSHITAMLGAKKS